MKILKACFSILDRIERAFAAMAAFLMAFIMVLVSIDVFMRYVLNHPLWWSYDLISIYAMCGLFFFVISHAFTLHAHINVDILAERVGEQTQRWFRTVSALVSMLAFAAITYAGTAAAISAFNEGDTTASGGWPTWPAMSFVPLGVGLLTVRLFLHFIVEMVSALGGADLIPGFHAKTAFEVAE